MAMILGRVGKAIIFSAGAMADAVAKPSAGGLCGRTRQCAELLNRSVGQLVLDVGCSDAWLAGSLGDSRHYVGVDMRPVVANGAALARASALALPVATGSVDVVTFFDVLEHLPKGTEREAMHEVRRVLKEGGTLLLSTPHRRVFGMVTDPAWWLAGHRHYRQTDVVAILHESGFEVRERFLRGGVAEALYLPFFYLSKRIHVRLPGEGPWRRRVDLEYSRRGWYTIFVTAAAIADQPSARQPPATSSPA